MARNTTWSTEPYRVGEIIEFLHSSSLGVIVDVCEDGRGVAVVVRMRPGFVEPMKLGDIKHPVSPRTGNRLPTFTGTLTDEEEVRAMRALLLGVPNNG